MTSSSSNWSVRPDNLIGQSFSASSRNCGPDFQKLPGAKSFAGRGFVHQSAGLSVPATQDAPNAYREPSENMISIWRPTTSSSGHRLLGNDRFPKRRKSDKKAIYCSDWISGRRSSHPAGYRPSQDCLNNNFCQSSNWANNPRGSDILWTFGSNWRRVISWPLYCNNSSI